MRLYLDARRYSVSAAEKAARPKAVFEDGARVEGRQAVNEAGVPLWTVAAMISDGDRIEAARVTFPASTTDAPGFTLGSPVQVSGLSAVVVDGKTYLTAEGLTAAKPQN